MQRNISSLQYLDHLTLKNWILQGKTNFQVIDVRGSDYIGGHIHGSWNYPYRHLTHSNINKLIQEIKEKRNNQDPFYVILHCAHSQQRGPSAALKLMRNLTDEELGLIHITILRGGFVKWASEYGNDKRLTDAYVSDLWE